MAVEAGVAGQVQGGDVEGVEHLVLFGQGGAEGDDSLVADVLLDYAEGTFEGQVVGADGLQQGDQVLVGQLDVLGRPHQGTGGRQLFLAQLFQVGQLLQVLVDVLLQVQVDVLDLEALLVGQPLLLLDRLHDLPYFLLLVLPHAVILLDSFYNALYNY